MVAPMLSRNKVIGLFNLESNTLHAYSREDLRLLETFAAQAGVSIERAYLYEERRVKRQLERELKVARTVQEFFTPRTSRKLGPFYIAGRNYPSLELSGDYFDVFPLKSPYVAFAIADVAGKGIPASIIMSSFRATLHTAAPYMTRAREIAIRANQILLETVRPEDFVTAFIGVLDPKMETITYCNAGHNPPVLMRPNGEYALLETGGTVLGAFEDAAFKEAEMKMGNNMLLCYTDGAVDACNAADQPFGLERLIRFLRKSRELPANRVCAALKERLDRHVENASLPDDVTFLVLKK
jgi:sigma-B regulation protein RsbU (phosphoserine phosphatase)